MTKETPVAGPLWRKNSKRHHYSCYFHYYRSGPRVHACFSLVLRLLGKGPNISGVAGTSNNFHTCLDKIRNWPSNRRRRWAFSPNLFRGCGCGFPWRPLCGGKEGAYRAHPKKYLAILITWWCLTLVKDAGNGRQATIGHSAVTKEGTWLAVSSTRWQLPLVFIVECNYCRFPIHEFGSNILYLKKDQYPPISVDQLRLQMSGIASRWLYKCACLSCVNIYPPHFPYNFLSLSSSTAYSKSLSSCLFLFQTLPLYPIFSSTSAEPRHLFVCNVYTVHTGQPPARAVVDNLPPNLS